MTTTQTVQVTAREEREVRAVIRREGGFVIRSSVIGNVVRDGQNMGNGFQITYMVDPR